MMEHAGNPNTGELEEEDGTFNGKFKPHLPSESTTNLNNTRPCLKMQNKRQNDSNIM